MSKGTNNTHLDLDPQESNVVLVADPNSGDVLDLRDMPQQVDGAGELTGHVLNQQSGKAFPIADNVIAEGQAGPKFKGNSVAALRKELNEFAAGKSFLVEPE